MSEFEEDDENDLFVRQENDFYQSQSLIEAVENERNGTTVEGYTYDGTNLSQAETPSHESKGPTNGLKTTTTTSGNHIITLHETEHESATLRDDIYNSEELFKSVVLSTPLSFQKTIIRDMLADDALLVLGRGLGLHLIAANILHALDVAGTTTAKSIADESTIENGTRQSRSSLVLLIGTNDIENSRISQELWQLSQLADPLTSCHRGLTIVSNETTTLNQREKLYKRGGIFSVRYQALVVDMLSGAIDCSKVTGIVAFDSDRRVDKHYLEWVIRLYRSKNTRGFIKALTENPEGFGTSGTLQPLAAKLKNLSIKRVLLWPRYHIEVTDSLLQTGRGRKRNEIIEIQVEKSEAVRRIQTAIMDSIESCISRIKRTTASIKVISTEEWNLDNALSMKLSRQVRFELRPYWHLLSYDARHAVGDLAVLEQLLDDVLSLDSVAFLQRLIEISKSATKSTRDVSQWLLEDAGSMLFQLAKERVYGKKSKDSTRPAIIEELPKWYHLMNILEEISAEKSNSNPDETGGPVLIMCKEKRTVTQLKAYIDTVGKAKNEPQNDNESIPPGQIYMKERLQFYIDLNKMLLQKRRSCAPRGENLTGVASTGESATNTGNDSTSSNRAPFSRNKRRRVRGGSVVASAAGRSVSPSLSLPEFEETIAEDTPIDADGLDDDIMRLISQDHVEEDKDILHISEVFSRLQVMDSGQLVVIQQYDRFNDDSMLAELRPSYIIMYEPDTSFFRRIEVTRASNPDRQIKAYFMFHKESVEEQRFLSEIRREKDAFTRLIREKANMAIHLETEKDTAARLTNNSTLLRNFSTRIAGGGQLGFNTNKPRVVVDVRELKAPLPAVLDFNNVEVVPMTLTVGDYILSPEICVERKSITDFIQSMKSGRLHEQCTAMCRYYEFPAVLIEFDDLDSFSFNSVGNSGPQPRSMGTADIDRFLSENDSLRTQISLLILQHPKLSLLWSPSPNDSAEIFARLKNERDEPDPALCARIGVSGGGNSIDYNIAAIDTLLAMPGITTNNYALITRKVPNIRTLCSMSEEDISAIIGKEAAAKLYRFFNETVQ
ncbi:ssDNA endodeoxyribonuclease RAD1 [Sugiyamaella lignohabitans]|uniref:SsDNA endodeoxyribonuclease RAD1 n=1 Tax=Sugiyamaella lignohabitans TaxID=796027 RepID=A0A167E6D5_9ASCO|nr:ssDNA endodeoxyribonuclease RAD1 [Sugiyamaella lignohabitans]ANB13700.1 ssDNA endodeoxyribonuclease RAD1 [Sugiyamaella lignohabitans]